MNHSWLKHYQTVGDQVLAPANTLLRCLSHIEQAKQIPKGALAIDLGCGNGIDTGALLAEGWSVLAIDKEMNAISRLESTILSTQKSFLQSQCIAFEQIDSLPSCKLINATFSLPFCHPSFFEQFWAIIHTATQPGGYFCGQFFGICDSWNNHSEMTFHSSEQVYRLFDSFKLLHFEEIEKKGKTISGKEKNWHIFHVVAQKN